MLPIMLVGLGSGAAAALLSASIASGSVLASLLAYLSPLPIMIAALGWSHWAGLLAALAAGAGLGTLLGPWFLVSFLLGIGLPAWWLAYLALLARPAGNPPRLEWYPAGRIVLWAALLATASITIALLQLGTDRAAVQGALRSALTEVIRAHAPGSSLIGTLAADEQDDLLDVFVVLLPPAAAVTLVVINCFNLWLAGRVVLVSGRLSRPWPAVSDLSLPIIAPVLLALALAGVFAPDLVGVVFGVLAASLMVAHVMVGLAVIHALTAGLNSRALILAGIYAGLVILGFQTSWAPFSLAALGLGETLFGIRGRMARRIRPGQHP